MSQMLTDEELERLTGASQRTKQKQWLDRNRIFYFINQKNDVVVTWKFVNDAKQIQSPSDSGPDFGALKAG